MTTAGRRGPDWDRLAEALLRRRVELGHRNRTQFAAAVGEKNDRTISDLEHARRDNYTPATLASMERIYQWEPGSIKMVLAGNDPIRTPGSPGETPADVDAAVRQQHPTASSVVDAIIEILNSRFGAATKISMIEDVIRDDYLPVGPPGD